jgi:protein SHQ1
VSVVEDAAAQIRTVRPTRSGLAVLCPAPHPTLSMSEAALLTQVPATPNPLLHRPAQSIAALVDILAATAYDIQTSEGQRTVESGWNIAMLSPALQWLDDARAHPADVAIAFCRRVAVYPLHRSFHLAMRCLRDVGVMLLQGPTVCVKVLLHAKAALDASERQHVLSTLWVNPMLSWLSAAAAMRDEPAQQLVAAMEDYADVLHTFLRTGQRRPFLASFLAAAEPSAFEELTASRRKVAVESLEPLNWRLLRLPLSNEMLQSPE